MRNAPIVPGVPSPYAMHVHPYPTRFHGAIYTRPVFSGRMIASPQDVFTPSYNIDRNMPQPTLSGLGAVQSQWDTGQGIFKPGGYGGGVFDGDISGLGSLSSGKQKHRRRRMGPMGALGDDASDYPWKVKSDKTAALQTATNQLLAEAALCPLTVDGKLGPGTCGARKYLNDNKDKFFTGISEIANPSTCQSYTLPAALSTGCGAGKSSPVTSAPQPVIDLDASAGMSSSTKRALGFALGGILAIGAVVMLRKKR